MAVIHLKFIIYLNLLKIYLEYIRIIDSFDRSTIEANDGSTQSIDVLLQMYSIR